MLVYREEKQHLVCRQPAYPRCHSDSQEIQRPEEKKVKNNRGGEGGFRESAQGILLSPPPLPLLNFFSLFFFFTSPRWNGLVCRLAGLCLSDMLTNVQSLIGRKIRKVWVKIYKLIQHAFIIITSYISMTNILGSGKKCVKYQSFFIRNPITSVAPLLKRSFKRTDLFNQFDIYSVLSL